MTDISSDARVTATEVREIFDTDLVDEDLNQFINMANRFVTAVLATAGLAAATLTDIELLISAHFAALKDPRTSQEGLGEWSFTGQGTTAMNLDATFYGQQAKLLDTTGTLDEIAANKQKATITVLKDVT